MDGTLEAAYKLFQASNNVSSHFGIGRDGRIWQFVRLEDSAWCQGEVTSTDGYWWEKVDNPNWYCISIELEGWEDEPKSDDQMEALVWLCNKAILAKFPEIPLDREHIIGHYQINPAHKTDPGDFDWEQFLDCLRRKTSWRAAKTPNSQVRRQPLETYFYQLKNAALGDKYQYVLPVYDNINFESIVVLVNPNAKPAKVKLWAANEEPRIEETLEPYQTKTYMWDDQTGPQASLWLTSNKPVVAFCRSVLREKDQ